MFFVNLKYLTNANPRFTYLNMYNVVHAHVKSVKKGKACRYFYSLMIVHKIYFCDFLEFSKAFPHSFIHSTNI